MKTILISGATGILGTRTLNRLSREDVKVLALCHDSSAVETYDNVKPITFEEFYDLNSKINDLEVLHLACPRKSDAESVMGGINFTHSFLAKALELGASRIVESSSQSVYDPYRKSPALETDVVCPVNLYGVAKYYSEKWISDFAKFNNIQAIHLRLSSLVGPSYTKRLTARMTNAAFQGEELSVNNIKDRFSFLHLDDCVEAIVTVLLNPNKEHCVYNIGTSESYNLEEVACEIDRQMYEACGKHVSYVVNKNDKEGINRSISVDRFMNDYGWVPKYTLHEIIKEEFEKNREL